jgi:hypothetical protein
MSLAEESAYRNLKPIKKNNNFANHGGMLPDSL